MTRVALVLFGCVLLVGALFITGVGTGAALPASPNPAVVQQTTENATNNTSVRHRNPDTYNQNGDTESVRQRLLQELASRLQGSTLNISEGQYESARDLLGGEFRETLGQYVDVAGETEGGEEQAEQLNETAETQREYASDVREFRRVYEAYLEAERAGNETRMRELARELNRLADRIRESGAELNRSYRDIENSTGINLDEEPLLNTTRNVTTTQRSISELLFTATRLSVSTSASSASFTDPLPIEGTLRTENGTAIANRSITLRVGSETLSTRTNQNGSFALAYRPVLRPTGNQTIPVAYEPAPTSVYRESESNITTVIESVSGTLTLQETPDSVRFGDTVSVRGDLQAANESVAGVPIRVRLDGTRLGVTTTGSDGSFALDSTLGISIPPGDVSLTADVAVDNRAVTADDRTVSVSIRETEPSLSLSVDRSDQVVNASGRLRANGVAVGNQVIEVSADGATLGTVRTDGNGAYKGSFALPDGANPEEMRASFGGQGNLDSAAAYAQVPPLPSSGESLPSWLWVALVVSLFVLGVGVYRYTRDTGEPIEAESTEPTSGASDEPVSETPDVTAALADRAAEQYDAEEFDAAVKSAYASVRAGLDIDVDAATHWEFYRAADLSGRADEALRNLTAGYERAAFAAEGVGPDTAADALENLDELRS